MLGAEAIQFRDGVRGQHLGFTAQDVRRDRATAFGGNLGLMQGLMFSQGRLTIVGLYDDEIPCMLEIIYRISIWDGLAIQGP